MSRTPNDDNGGSVVGNKEIVGMEVHHQRHPLSTAACHHNGRSLRLEGARAESAMGAIGKYSIEVHTKQHSVQVPGQMRKVVVHPQNVEEVLRPKVRRNEGEHCNP
jgi:hypothetical protein